MKTNKIIGLSVVALLALSPFMEAGKIGPLDPQAAPSHSSGFGGWNLDNVNVKMTDIDYDDTGYAQSFNKTDGSYNTMTVGDAFEVDIYDSLDTSGNIMAQLHGKDWPVGEPSGIKVIDAANFDDVMSHSKPASCIMTTSYLEEGYLDAANPIETVCSSDFQTHKRFKINMLPSMWISDGNWGNGVNLTFNAQNVAETWRYMVLQKANNYTTKRLDGIKIEIGFLDAGGAFTTASANGADLRLSIGAGEDNGGDIWASDELATFAHGLWGPIDSHFTTTGFFDEDRAGFNVALTNADTITTGAPLVSNYSALEVPLGAVATQLGDWPPSIWAPKGIFWDDDNDPTTDAELMAFWGDKGDGTYTWMKGDHDNFAEATALDLATWASSPVHTIGAIEDVLNLGLNYIVEIGDTTGFPAAANGTFTIRITPHFAATQVAPGYVANGPTPLSSYVDENGTLSITPEPTFVIGNDLTLVVADSGLNANAGLAETVDVNVTTDLGEYELITLTEIGPDRAVFTANLSTVSGTVAGADSDGSINVTEGTLVTTNYEDADDGAGTAIVTASTTAAVAPPPVVSVTSDDDGGSSFAVNDTVSLLFTIFGFLVIGGLIARRKLA